MTGKKLLGLVLALGLAAGLLILPASAAEYTVEAPNRLISANQKGNGNIYLDVIVDTEWGTYENVQAASFPAGVTLRPGRGLRGDLVLYEMSPGNQLAMQNPFRQVVTVPGTVYRVETLPDRNGRVRVAFAHCPAETEQVLPGEPIYDIIMDKGGWGMPFIDVPADFWAGGHISRIYSRGIMKGTSANTFTPQGRLTRAALWTMLARIEGVEDDPAVYYKNAQRFVEEHKIADPTQPGAQVTRQEFAAMLYRYWQYAGLAPYSYNRELGLAEGDPDRLPVWEELKDRDQVSADMAEAVKWAVDAGILTGDSAGKLRPAAPVTRAHVAKMMDRFVADWSSYISEKLDGIA